MSNEQVDIAVIGAGFFGLYLAEFFALQGKRVLVLEKENDAMQRASFVNQARVHNGYHYPRSILTALRSRIAFPRFAEEFADCIHSDFDKYYMIANPLGKVTAQQFKVFCERIGAPCDEAPEAIKQLTNPKYIKGVFQTTEFAFDAVKLKQVMCERLQDAKAEIRFNYQVQRVRQAENHLLLTVSDSNDNSNNSSNNSSQEIAVSDHVFNCTYSMLNAVPQQSAMAMIPLRHEMTEMCLIDVPEPLKNVGITVMCGPFFSVMPFPSTDKHTFSHVRYTPHYQWSDHVGQPYSDAHQHFEAAEKRSAWRQMIYDARRYIPILGESVYHDSLWEVKTILPRSDNDDSRPILFKAHYGLPNFHCVMGGKIDNVYDVIATIKELGLT